MRPEISSASKSRRAETVPPPNSPSDPGIASYFVWLRRHTGLSLHQTAALLHTEAEVVAALEAGAIAELPAWSETARIVGAYTALARVEPTAPLEALRMRWPSLSSNQRRAPDAVNATPATKPRSRLW